MTMMAAMVSGARRRSSGTVTPQFTYDWSAGSALGGETVARSTTGTRYTSAGVRQTIAANTARFNYSRVSPYPFEGVLIEPTSTNLILNSDVANSWGKSAVTVANSGTGIDGSSTLETVTSNGTANAAIFQTPAAFTSGSALTFQFVLKRGNNDWVSFAVFNSAFSDNCFAYYNLGTLATGNFYAGTAFTLIGRSIRSIGDGFIEITQTIQTTGVTTVNLEFALRSSDNDFANAPTGRTFIFDSAQMEARNGATSYIATTTAAVARTAETLSVTAPNGTYDIFVKDSAGSEWRNGVTVSGGAYPVTVRTGQLSVVRVSGYTAGTLTQAQKDDITAGGTGGSGGGGGGGGTPATLNTMFHTPLTSGTSTSAGSGTTYYLDTVAGNDGLAGTSEATAWKNWSRVVSQTMAAGSTLLIKRNSLIISTGFPGTTFSKSGSSGNPITIGAYGSGTPPLFRCDEPPASSGGQNFGNSLYISGNYVTVKDCNMTAAAATITQGGIKVHNNNNVIIDNCEIYDVPMGIFVEGATTVVMQNCYIHDMKMHTNDAAADNDYGAEAFHIQNSSNITMRRNTMKNIIASSIDYGFDGTCCEIYVTTAVSNILFQHNYVEDSLAFVEFGGTSAGTVSNVTFDHNISRNLQGVLFAHVGGGTAFQIASITNLLFQNNTIHSTLANTSGTQSVFAFAGGNGAFLTSRNNIFSINAMDTFDSSSGTMTYAHSNNLYYLGSVPTRAGYTTAANEYTGDPLFVDATNKNYNLTGTSPALSRATATAGSMNGYSYQVDFTGLDLSARANLDIGAVEYQD